MFPVCSKFEIYCCASSSSPLTVMVIKSKPEAWIHSGLNGSVLSRTPCKDWWLNSALFLAVALFLPLGTTAFSLVMPSHTDIFYMFPESVCGFLLTVLWKYPWVCFGFLFFVFFLNIDDFRITTSLWFPFLVPLLWIPTGTSNPAHLELNLPSSQTYVFIFVLLFIHLISQHIFFYYLLWSRQWSRHQGFRVDK